MENSILAFFLFLAFLILTQSTTTDQLAHQYSDYFKGKVGIITGGSSGFGYATTLLLAQMGAKIVFCARDAHPDWFTGSSAESKIRSDPLVLANNGEVSFIKADIREISQMRALIQEAHHKYGVLDFALNNAGFIGWVKPIDALTEDDLWGDHDPIKNNLYGTLNCMIEETKYWMEYGDPEKEYAIVNLASWTRGGTAGAALYGASKAGVVGLTQSASKQFLNTKPRIRVNGLGEGLSETSMTRQQLKLDRGQQVWEDPYITQDNVDWLVKKEKMAEGTSCGFLAQPRDMSEVILYLLSDQSSYVSGSIYYANNGDIANVIV
jgi:NAD(P)-dependent dehydrogenase (short-subunit alcohol dehydrogenase family)